MRLKTAETLSGNLSQQTSFNRLYTNLSIRPFLGGGGGGRERRLADERICYLYTAFFKKGIRYKR